MKLATIVIRDTQCLVLCFDGHVFDVERIWKGLGQGFFKVDIGLHRDPRQGIYHKQRRGRAGGDRSP